ncbi:protein UPSTREAM OF FLC-like protein [Cinnamomum micranthum f. kanehirae]|uniref:Protein UPSTREAM OF FLC-like protein n=1 Tax=Cinnamomum micranthum f. kanehirae TaxID=337451 RepID=A0A443PQH2_9MAGN|nr:protein UPSTREAM OF FLC-like protein [Cinnamomum micranthum f. kanehirae]
MDIRPRKNRETSPDRVRRCMQPKPMKALRKVQVLYYLSRNGQLEHPHFMEVSHLANQQLRLKDVIDRLTVLRGSGMPSLFSWSCKRSYKNGYVWNDLSENDVIHPAEGAEYVLKGSEVIEGCAERFQHIHLSNRQQQTPEANFLPKRKYLLGNRNNEEEYMGVEEEEKVSNNSSFNTPNSWRSKGVSTDEIAETHNPKTQNNATELSLDDGSPPSSSSTLSEKTQNGNSQRFEECDSGVEPATTRHSVLLQLIACGSSITNSTRNAANVANGRKSSSLHKGVLCKTAAKSMNEDDEINYMSENPRFGNPQSEEKEYFSGSIVESMTENRVSAEPALKKSSSYNEERSLKSGMAVEQLEKREEEVKGMKGKCIPRKTCCSKPQKK